MSVLIKTIVMSLYLIMVLSISNMSVIIGLSYTPTIVIFMVVAEAIVNYFKIGWNGWKQKN
mgnify:CR=1 FL=1